MWSYADDITPEVGVVAVADITFTRTYIGIP